MMREIFPGPLASWEDLETKVCQLFEELGCSAARGETVQTVRGEVAVDVVVRDGTRQPEALIFCECKRWNRPVPKSIVHGFRSVVQDAGASLGFIISDSGFQAGAFDAARHSNVKLVTWAEFQDQMFDRWFSSMEAKLGAISDEIVAISESTNDRTTSLMEHAIDRGGDDAYEVFDAMARRYSLYPFCATSGNWQPIRSFPFEGTDPRQPVQQWTTYRSPREYFDIMLGPAQQAFDDFARFIVNRCGGIRGDIRVLDDERLASIEIGRTTRREVDEKFRARVVRTLGGGREVWSLWGEVTEFDFGPQLQRRRPLVRGRYVDVTFDKGGTVEDLNIKPFQHVWRPRYPTRRD